MFTPLGASHHCHGNGERGQSAVTAQGSNVCISTRVSQKENPLLHFHNRFVLCTKNINRISVCGIQPLFWIKRSQWYVPRLPCAGSRGALALFLSGARKRSAAHPLSTNHLRQARKLPLYPPTHTWHSTKETPSHIPLFIPSAHLNNIRKKATTAQTHDLTKTMSDPQAQSTNFKEAFSLFDKRGTSRVPLDSLGDLLRACGQNPTLAEIRDLETQVGGQKDFDFDAFTRVLNRPGGFRDPGEPEEYCRGFQVFDKELTGFIGVGQFRYILTNLGEKMSEEEVDELLKAVDTSSGELNYMGEFLLSLFWTECVWVGEGCGLTVAVDMVKTILAN